MKVALPTEIRVVASVLLIWLKYICELGQVEGVVEPEQD